MKRVESGLDYIYESGESGGNNEILCSYFTSEHLLLAQSNLFFSTELSEVRMFKGAKTKGV